MARTRVTARAGSPPPRGPREPRKATSVVRKDLPTKEVDRIHIFNDRMEVYYDESAENFNWKEMSAEELYPFWADVISIEGLGKEDEDIIPLLTSKMNDLNLFGRLHIKYGNEKTTLALLECFRPKSVTVWVDNEFKKDFLLCDEIKYSTKIELLSYVKENLFGLECLAVRDNLEDLSVEEPTCIEWQFDVLKTAFEKWIIGSNALKSVSLNFPESTTVAAFESKALDGLQYEVLWRFQDHANSILRDKDTERFKQFEGHEAAVFAFTRQSTQQKAVLYLIENTINFQLITGDIEEEVDYYLYCAAMRFT